MRPAEAVSIKRKEEDHGLQYCNRRAGRSRKSTIARRVAARLSFIYVDTGAMYRAMGLYFLEKGISPEDAAAIEAAVEDISVSIRYENGEQQVWLNGKDVSGQIRREEVGNMASRTSANARVRKKLVALQRELAKNENVVMDGRDIGTCVLPDATVKIYLTADPAERARRRYLELKEKGVEGNLQEIEADIRERDHRDMTREISPLRRADDAVLVDASHISIDQVTDAVLAAYEEKR